MEPQNYAVIGIATLTAAEAGYLIWRQQREQTTKQPTHQIILDTCALIDGRITEIVRSGFVPGKVIIPQFVIAELQFLADHGDAHKRERARYGLDVIRALQDLRNSDVEIARQNFPDIREVDDKLIALAKQTGAMLYTTDYNLNKVAQIEGVVVLNVNELAQALRPNHLPGEKLEIKVTQVGQEKTQGVGYLEDGTMVVIERAGNKIGQKLVVELTRMLQTQAGKMAFAVLPERQNAQRAAKPQRNQQQAQPQQPAVEKPAQVAEKKAEKKPAPPKAAKRAPQQHKQVYHARPQQNRRRTTPEDALLHAVERQQ